MEDEYKKFKVVLIEYLKENLVQRKIIATHQPYLKLKKYKNCRFILRWCSKKNYLLRQRQKIKINCTTFTLIFFNIHLLLTQYKLNYLNWYLTIINNNLSRYYFHENTKNLWLDLKIFIKKNDDDLYTQLPDCFFYSIEITPTYSLFLIRYIIEETLMFYRFLKNKQTNLKEFIFFMQIIKNTMYLYNNRIIEKKR